MTSAIAWFLLIIPILYLLTMARSLVLGDPTEFTFVANTLGIAHPPGYAFITVVGKLFQTVIPLGTIPWRMHLLSATAATFATLAVYGTVRTVDHASGFSDSPTLRQVAALFAGLTVGTGADHWQHAIHTNPHIMTATFLAANLYFLSKWWSTASGGKALQTDGKGKHARSVFPEKGVHSDRWLYVFCLSAGLGVTHHPLTLFSFPAYALFVLWTKPILIRQWRQLLKMAMFALLGLSVWLYFPIRSPMEPAFGPSTMNTVDGFLDHILARGLTESLPFYGLSAQPDRAVIFGSLLRLQYSVPVVLLLVLTFRTRLSVQLSLRHQSEGSRYHGLSVGPTLDRWLDGWHRIVWTAPFAQAYAEIKERSLVTRRCCHLWVGSRTTSGT
jgi:hypothetical protein